MAAALITFDHFADSTLKNSLHSSGVLATVSKAIVASFFLTSGCAWMAASTL